MRLIETQADVDAGAAWLLRCEPGFAAALALTGPLPLRRKPDGFEALLDAIVSQQVSLASARAIWARLQAARLCDAHRIMAASDDDLRAVGLSRPKMRYVRALAAADLPYPALREMADEAVIARLTQVTGIGRWSAEIYALQSLGRPDVFAAGDLALQEAAKLVFHLPTRPSEATLREMAAAWSPYRSVAARLLWAYYGVQKSPTGISR